MKKLTTVTQFKIIEMPLSGGWKHREDKNGEPIKFKSRRSAENYCMKNKVGYVEIKHIFYR